MSAEGVVFARRARLEHDAATPYGTYPSLLVYDDDMEQWLPLRTVLFLSTDSLALGDNAIDGFTSHYRRLRN